MFDLYHLYRLQKDLDKKVFETNNTTRKETLKSRTLALLVEFGELMNETQNFKYWKQNKNINRDKVLEELVDVLHFALSIAIDDLGIEEDPKLKQRESMFCNINFSYSNIDAYDENFLADSLIRLLYRFIRNDFSYTKSLVFLSDVICFGLNLGFTIEEIKEAYKKKNQTNLKRIEARY